MHVFRNWSPKKRAFVALSLCLLTFTMYIGSAIYTPSIPGIMQEFNVSLTHATLGLTLYVLGKLGTSVDSVTQANMLCLSLWYWTNVSCPLAGTSSIRTKPHIHQHLVPLPHLPDPHYHRDEHSDHPRNAFPYRLLWQPGIGDRRRIHG